MKAPFPVDPVLTGITLAHHNRRFIADQVMPRINPPLDRETFKYKVWDVGEQYRLPDTLVGRSSYPNEVEFSATEVPGATEDHALDDFIPAVDLANAGDSLAPQMHASETLSDLIGLGREKRVAAIVHSGATYPSGFKAELTGDDRWDVVDEEDSDPIADIMAGLDVPLMRPNTMVIGRPAWTKLIQHPKINKAVHANSGDAGVAQRRKIAELFELDDVLVGEAFINSTKKGQNNTFTRVWGKHCALLYLDPLAMGDKNRITFGSTFQFGTRVAGSIPDPKRGLRGGVTVRVGESVVEKVQAATVGYFLENVIS